MDIRSAVPSPSIEVLSWRYAAAVDARDEAALLSVFLPDATLTVDRRDQPPFVFRSHDQLRKIIRIITGWARTYHLIGQALFEIGDGVAQGQVYCTAHHFDSPDYDTGTDEVMYIRYHDDYALDVDGEWRIASRTVTVDATSTQPVSIPATASTPASAASSTDPSGTSA